MRRSASASSGLRARPCLLRIVEREAHHRRRDPLLEAVELADLDLGPELRIAHVHPAERDVLLQHGRARPARADADLMAADVDAVAVRPRLVALELEADEHALRVRTPLRERLLTHEVVRLVGSDREADAR